ncbi:proteasome subunit beta type-11a [Megalops cyprinoides]|uniref:proteasome subunit beta type-11a n=1 Tax=Megalops cyprinoides TaxID=118141 RepID=UPI001863B586|nr:proteasome subunit beta type-11a [Megalops cyprinoides]
MALQDVCGFWDSPVYPRWNTPASLSMPVGDATELFTQNPLQVERDGQGSVAPPFALSHGTTTLAFVFQGGIVAAADTRASCSGLVCCPAARKVLPVHSHLVVTTSGSAADCMLWERVLARECRLYQLRHRRRLPTGGAAKLLSHMLHPFKGTDVCVAAMLCGWDRGEGGGAGRGDGGMSLEGERRGYRQEQKCSAERRAPVSAGRDRTASQTGGGAGSGPRLYYVCSDGTRLQGELFSVGSGSPYAYSVLDGGVRWELGVAEACSLAREAVFRAAHRDAYSGNCVDLYHVTARGWRRREREDLKEEYYRERERERERVEERRKEREREEGEGEGRSIVPRQ